MHNCIEQDFPESVPREHIYFLSLDPVIGNTSFGMEEFLMKIMYELPDKNGVNECIIDRQTVLTGEAKYCSNGRI